MCIEKIVEERKKINNEREETSIATKSKRV